MNDVKPFTYVAATQNALVPITTANVFNDLAIASEDSALYLDVDGSGNFVEVGETFSAAELGLTSGMNEVAFRFVQKDGTIGGTLKLNVGDEEQSKLREQAWYS